MELRLGYIFLLGYWSLAGIASLSLSVNGLFGHVLKWTCAQVFLRQCFELTFLQQFVDFKIYGYKKFHAISQEYFREGYQNIIFDTPITDARKSILPSVQDTQPGQNEYGREITFAARCQTVTTVRKGPGSTPAKLNNSSRELTRTLFITVNGIKYWIQ